MADLDSSNSSIPKEENTSNSFAESDNSIKSPIFQESSNNDSEVERSDNEEINEEINEESQNDNLDYVKNNKSESNEPIGHNDSNSVQSKDEIEQQEDDNEQQEDDNEQQEDDNEQQEDLSSKDVDQLSNKGELSENESENDEQQQDEEVSKENDEDEQEDEENRPKKQNLKTKVADDIFGSDSGSDSEDEEYRKIGSKRKKINDSDEDNSNDSDLVSNKKKSKVDDDDSDVDESEKKSKLDDDDSDVDENERTEEKLVDDKEQEEDDDQNKNKEILPDISSSSSDDELEDDRSKKSGGNDFVYDFDLMMSKRKEQNARNRRRKNTDIINDSDDFIADLITQMKQAAEDDFELNKERKAATRKMKLLPQVQTYLKKIDLRESFLDSGVLSVITDWLTPLPDRSLPNLQVRETLLKILLELNIMDVDRLKSSSVGKAVMYLYKHPKETKENKRLAAKLITNWARPIFACETDFHSISKEDREERDYANMQKVRKLSIEASSSQSSSSNNNQPTGSIKPGDKNWVPRARVPMPSTKDYVVRPKSTIEFEMGRSSKKQTTRLDKHLRNMQEKKRSSKMQRAVKISIEGRKL